ncbi:MAG: hypothetical protein H0X08_03645 [Blastocatellia bacterium]|nr:hypothetical protein [Blastocatellia bacterium]
MKLNGFIKRAFFFLAAFALGITATGLLFGFTAPRWTRGHRGHKKQCVKKLKAENERLLTENWELKRELEEHLYGEPHGHGRGDGAGTIVPPPTVPIAPVAPHNHN